MDYSKFNVEDFASDDYFIRWVGGNDPEAEKFWALFISLHPELKSRVQEARMIVTNLQRLQPQPAATDDQVDIIWASLEKRIESSATSPLRKQVSLRVTMAIAASLTAIILLIGGIYLSHGNFIEADRPFEQSVRAATEDYAEEVNTGETPINIHLSEGSIVSLEKDSRLRYRKAYNGQASRDVFLAGQASFDVAKNPNQPFFVHANEVTTKVLGTSFSVKAYRQDKEITVTVSSGKVSVFSPKEKTSSDKEKAEVNAVILLPNQKVVYQREQKSFEKTLVETPEVLSPSVTESNFTFDNAPITDVFRVLEDAYGIEIIFDEELMKNCFITAPLGSEPMFDKLRIICRTIGANYEIIDTKVVITSSGCH